jgi:glyoxylase-like metal-dependent hydrolase (beta-lactamase superfamily II)
MILRQLFDSTSSTYSYLIASRHGAEALIIDPVLEKVDRYVQLLKELDLRLVKAIDTHLHADHITGLPALRERWRCALARLAGPGRRHHAFGFRPWLHGKTRQSHAREHGRDEH